MRQRQRDDRKGMSPAESLESAAAVGYGWHTLVPGMVKIDQQWRMPHGGRVVIVGAFILVSERPVSE